MGNEGVETGARRAGRTGAHTSVSQAAEPIQEAGTLLLEAVSSAWG
jgi:hypothetical protein